jgi:hypothetical protein
MIYPDRFIRGISNKGYVDPGGLVSGEIFSFDDAKRDDGFFESSINWYDNEEALSLLMNEQKNGELKYKVGVAIIKKISVDRLILEYPKYEQVLGYERSPKPDNKYHGNLLLNYSLIQNHFVQLSKVV